MWLELFFLPLCYPFVISFSLFLSFPYFSIVLFIACILLLRCDASMHLQRDSILSAVSNLFVFLHFRSFSSLVCKCFVCPLFCCLRSFCFFFLSTANALMVYVFFLSFVCFVYFLSFISSFFLSFLLYRGPPAFAAEGDPGKGPQWAPSPRVSPNCTMVAHTKLYFFPLMLLA